MCTPEEVNKIIHQSEQRIMSLVHKELDNLRKEVRLDRESSHMALSKSISNLGAEFLTAVKELKDWRREIDVDIQNLKAWRAEHNVEAKYIAEKIDAIFSGVKWIITLGGSAVVLAVLGLVLK
jgi:uncharacterized coiled-coil DUF342 family protein